MTKIYTTKYPKDLVKDEQGQTENDRENDAKAVSQATVRFHQAWVKSEYYPHVLAIVDQWLVDVTSPSQFSPETLSAATPEEVKAVMVLSLKVQAEMQKLKKRLS